MNGRSGRLATLARVRDLQEKRAATAVAEAAAARAHRDAVVTRAEQVYAQLAPGQVGQQTAQVLLRHETLSARAASVHAAHAAAAVAGLHEQERRAEHVQARRNAEMLQRLHEQAVGRERAHLAAQEQLAIDDVTAARWLRAQRQDPSGAVS